MAAVTATLIGMAIAKGVSEYAAAKKTSSAAKKAAETQATGTQQALDFAKQMWGVQQNAQQPYLQAGGQAAGLLGGLMTPQGAPGAYRPGQNYAPPPLVQNPFLLTSNPMHQGSPMTSAAPSPRTPPMHPQQMGAQPPNPWSVVTR